MNAVIEVLRAPWPWYVSGAVISATMFFLIFAGKSFGFSSNFRIICAACGAGKYSNFFDFDWKSQRWNLLFLVGAVIGGWIGAQWLSHHEPPAISEATINMLAQWGVSAPEYMQPAEIFDSSVLTTWKGWLILITGGLLVGFGTRYAGGCTSGHAISGLSNLQLPSLIAVIGFFVGGLIMSFLVLPYLF